MNYSQYLNNKTYVIYLFHGVIQEQKYKIRNYNRKHIPADYFKSVLEDLKKEGNPISLEDIVWAQTHGKNIPPRSFVITFDDGFENNSSIAAPILADLKIPATFYITTGFVENNSGSWVDRIENVIESKDTISVDMGVNGLSGEFRSIKEKIDFLEKIRGYVKKNKHVNADKFADEFCQKAGATSMILDPELDQKMSPSQVKKLSDNSLFTVGGHSHRHTILSFLNPKELEEELDASLSRLRLWTKSSISHYSYPEGLSHCYSPQVVKFLKEKGIVCCPTAESGDNQLGDDLFLLKRIMVV